MLGSSGAYASSHEKILKILGSLVRFEVYDYDYDYEITLFEHKQNQHIHIIIVQ